MQFTMGDIWSHMGIFAKGIVMVMAVMLLASLIVVDRVLLIPRACGKIGKHLQANLIVPDNFRAVLALIDANLAPMGKVRDFRSETGLQTTVSALWRRTGWRLGRSENLGLHDAELCC